MLKLIKLEYKKNNISKYIRNALILSVLLAIFFFAFVFLGIANDPETGIPDAASDANGVTVNVELITSIAYMIFAAAMHASFTISSYKNNTMNLMFSYPIKRRQILVSQMAGVWLFSFVALSLTKLAIFGMIAICGQFMTPAFIIDYDILSISFYILLLIKSVMTVSISLIALFVGLLLKSSKAALVTSFLLIILMQGNLGGVELADNILLPTILTIISFLFAYLTTQNIETRDIG
ncbi:ABC transporter permease [Anaerosporobacter sp.]|uniref:ABC transporter permease n=1 Tax=Anaerosporobacter sp. TaxID=1872529 RepID=UPI00286F0B53|nr:ABC transporter permease [Anaerosporobacter sp.]